MHVIAPLKGKVALVQKPFTPTQLPFCVGGRNPGQEIPRDQKSPGRRNPRAHCSNPEGRVRKKMQPRSETAMRTLMKRASKRAPT